MFDFAGLTQEAPGTPYRKSCAHMRSRPQIGLADIGAGCVLCQQCCGLQQSRHRAAERRILHQRTHTPTRQRPFGPEQLFVIATEKIDRPRIWVACTVSLAFQRKCRQPHALLSIAKLNMARSHGVSVANVDPNGPTSWGFNGSFWPINLPCSTPRGFVHVRLPQGRWEFDCVTCLDVCCCCICRRLGTGQALAFVRALVAPYERQLGAAERSFSGRVHAHGSHGRLARMGEKRRRECIDASRQIVSGSNRACASKPATMSRH